jgi:WD40 repeat protein
MGSLFVSHSSQDSAAVARLCDWLTGQGFRSFFLDFDPERGLAVGVKWEAELYAQLRRADAVLFVGSPASVASQWCFAELAMTRSLGKTIIPVAVRPGGSHPLLADTQTVDLSGADERGFERLRRRLSMAELDPERTFEWEQGRSPFPGLESFQERDAAVFFGRRAETELLLAQMRSSRRRYTGRLIGVVGPSGSGKSSLARAGLFPRLARAQPPWVVLSVLRPADRPLRQLALAFVDAFRECGTSRALQSVELSLREGAVGLVALAEQLRGLYPAGSTPAVVVFVDQAEELITPGVSEKHARFLGLLHAATRGEGPVWSLLTLRSEFLSAFLQIERGEFEFDDQLLVGPLDSVRLAEVIERPADRAGLTFAPGLVVRMVADTAGGDALPLLAHTLAALYERARTRRGATITIEDYEDLGGVVGALRLTADEERRRLAERGLSDLVIPILSRLLTVGPEGELTRRRLERGALGRQENEVAEAFIDARLLTSFELDGESVVEVAHEALLRQWPPLTAAIERDREALQLRSELERAAKDWERSGRRDEYLLTGERLALADRLSGSGQRTATDLTALERVFLATSQDRQRSKEAADRRRTRRAVAGLALALVVVSALALVAAIQRSQATNQRDIAQAERLATDAISELTTDPGQSLVFGIQAYAKKRTHLAEGALRVAVSQATPQVVMRGHRETVKAVAFGGDGRHLASAAEDGMVRVWDWRSPRTPPTILRGNQGRATVMAFAGDGRHLASADSDGTVRVWDWRSPRTPPTILRGNDYTVTALAFAGDGRHLASTPEDGTVRVWDWRSPRTPPTILRGGRLIQGAVAFAGDGRHLASGGGSGTVRVWDWRSPRTPPTILRGGRLIQGAVAFAGDGRHLASAEGGIVRVWDWRSPHPRSSVLRGHEGAINVVAFTGDGRYIATAGVGGTVRVWDWRSPRTPVSILRGHQGSVFAVAFTGDGRYLVSAGEDRPVRVWDWRVPRIRATVLRGHHGRISAMAFADDGRYLASAGEDQTVQVRDWRASRARPTVLRSNEKFENGVVFAGDGRHLASADSNGTVRVWDWRSPRIPPTILRDYKPSGVAAFADDGRHLASAAYDGAVRVWDWRSPHTRSTVLRGHHGYITAVAFAGDGRHLATAERGVVRVWDWRSPRTPPILLRSNQGLVFEVVFSDDGRYLASGGADGTVRVWDWRSPRTPVSVLRRHQGLVSAVVFSDDGGYLASGGADGTVRVWDWRMPHIPATVLRGHQGLVSAVVFTDDGRHLASAGRDGTIRIWECERCGDIKEVLSLARARVRREIGSP